MIKNILLPLVLITATSAVAQTRPTAQSADACEKKVEAVVRSTAARMSKKKFGFQLRKEAGKTLQGQPMTIYKSGVFIVPEGYLSNSGAEVGVTGTGANCEIVRVNVMIGG